jgi:hypothetical protein
MGLQSGIIDCAFENSENKLSTFIRPEFILDTGFRPRSNPQIRGLEMILTPGSFQAGMF